jgi:hypothetical protein
MDKIGKLRNDSSTQPKTSLIDLGLLSSKLKKSNEIKKVGVQLFRRKELLIRRKKIANIMLFFGFLGLFLMILIIELDLKNQRDLIEAKVKISLNKVYSIFLIKCFLTFSTFILVCLIFIYHWLDINYYCINNSIDDWRIALSMYRFSLLLLELLVCIVHPFPYQFITELTEPVKVQDNSISFDVFFSIPMFGRLYLFCRVLLLNSKLVSDASSQSLGFLNKVNFNFRFFFKTIMNQYPEKVLALLIILLFFITSWSMRACENSGTQISKLDLLNSMWLIAITFLTIG